MAFILTPKNGEKIVVNAWNWRPTLELLRTARLIDDDLAERMGIHGCAATVDADTARRIAEFIDLRLEKMKQGERIRADLVVTDQPKKPLVITPDTNVDQIDAVDVYSATYEWLCQFRDFSRASGGFNVS